MVGGCRLIIGLMASQNYHSTGSSDVMSLTFQYMSECSPPIKPGSVALRSGASGPAIILTLVSPEEKILWTVSPRGSGCLFCDLALTAQGQL